jgi:septum formation protein
LLEALGIAVDVITSDADEHVNGSPAHVATDNARIKRDTVMTRVSDPAVVIAADTIVVVDNDVLNKPADMDEARSMIRRLAGRTHEVITGLAVGNTTTGTRLDAHEVTRVTFRELGDEEIDAFVEAVRPLDRAGAYTVDGPGSLLVARYDGCFYNVLGLPLVCLDNLLRGLNVHLFRRVDGRQAVFL